MVSMSVARDLEALVDLFLSPSFHPFDLPQPFVLEENRAEPDILYEADADEDDVHTAAFTRQCGRVLAELGDSFYKTYKTAESSAPKDPPWFGVGEKLKSLFTKVIEAKVKGPNFEEEKKKAWSQFKDIMSTAVAETPVADAYKQLGAVLLTLNGLSNLASGARGLARIFFIRYIRERQLDAEIQRLGGLDSLVEQEVD